MSVSKGRAKALGSGSRATCEEAAGEAEGLGCTLVGEVRGQDNGEV